MTVPGFVGQHCGPSAVATDRRNNARDDETTWEPKNSQAKLFLISHANRNSGVGCFGLLFAGRGFAFLA